MPGGSRPDNTERSDDGSGVHESLGPTDLREVARRHLVHGVYTPVLVGSFLWTWREPCVLDNIHKEFVVGDDLGWYTQ